MACAMQAGFFTSPGSIVLTAGMPGGPTLRSSSGIDALQGAAARLGNVLISSSPVTWLFGADPGFEWFEVPESSAGRAGATLGNVGYFLGGAAGVVRKGAATALTASRRGTTVLGHYPEYLAKAEQLGSRRFNIPGKFRATMSLEEKWAANARFLDRLIARGDDVVMATPLDRVRPGSTLEREIGYLLGHGYEVVDDGWRLTLGF
jgi:hypothetical protein